MTRFLDFVVALAFAGVVFAFWGGVGALVFFAARRGFRGVRGWLRPRSWRELQPSRWRGFLFTLRKRPGLALRWAFKRWVCGPLVSLARAPVWLWRTVSWWGWVRRRMLRRRAISEAAWQSAWGRVECARNFNVNFKNNGGVR